jgi:plastocyanin
MAKLVLRGSVIAGLILSLSACKGFPFRTPPQGTVTVSPQGTGTVSPQVTGTVTPQVISGRVNVVLQDNAFHPRQFTVKVGTTIIWVNKDPAFHSVVSDDGLFKSGLLAIGQSFSYTFDKAGTYPYYCSVHGGAGGKGMSGEIIVVP